MLESITKDLKQYFSRFTRPQDCDIFYLYCKDVLASGAVRTCELLLFRQDGSEFWASLTGLAVRNAQGINVLRFVLNDVTGRKRIDEEIKASDERFRLMFDRATEGILILSESGKLLRVNDAFAHMHGFTPTEMVSLHLQDLGTPETMLRMPERMKRVLSGEAQVRGEALPQGWKHLCAGSFSEPDRFHG